MIEIDPQPHPRIVNAHRLRGGIEKFPFGQRRGVGIKSDDLQIVPLVFPAHQRLQRKRHPLGLGEFAVPHHAAGHVQQHHRRAGGLVFGVVDDQIFLGDLDRRSAALPVKGVLERFVQVEVRHRIAELVGLGFLVQRLPGASELRFVLAELVLAGDVEQFFEGFVLDPLDAFGRDEKPAFLVFLDVALFDEQIDQVGMFLFPVLLSSPTPPRRIGACIG